MECIGCAQCIDACDEMMIKVGRPVGLVRYDSLEGFEGEKEGRVLRPRVLIYGAVSAAALVIVALNVFALRTPFEANLLRSAGIPYVLEPTTIRNHFELHLINKHVEPAEFEVSVVGPEGTSVIVPQPLIRLGPLEGIRTPVMVTVDRARYHGPFELKATVKDLVDGTDPRAGRGVSWATCGAAELRVALGPMGPSRPTSASRGIPVFESPAHMEDGGFGLEASLPPFQRPARARTLGAAEADGARRQASAVERPVLYVEGRPTCKTGRPVLGKRAARRPPRTTVIPRSARRRAGRSSHLRP